MPNINKYITVIAVAVSITYTQPGTSAENSRNDELLHNAHCNACHQPDIYTRKKRRVNSYQELVQQVKNCNHMLSKNFSKSQINGLVKYLNSKYYKFK